jgi:hypothetical protein
MNAAAFAFAIFLVAPCVDRPGLAVNGNLAILANIFVIGRAQQGEVWDAQMDRPDLVGRRFSRLTVMAHTSQRTLLCRCNCVRQWLCVLAIWNAGT